MNLPPELISEVISYVTDPRDVIALLTTNKTLATFTKRCIEILRYDGRNDNTLTIVDADFVLKLRRLRVVEPYIMPKYITDIVLVAQMPFISQVAFDFRSPDDDFSLNSGSDTCSVMMKMFLSAFHKSRRIDDEGNLIITTRYLEPKDRFLFRCPDSIDIIIRGNTFACLSEVADDITNDDDERKYNVITSDYVYEDRLVLNIPTEPARFEYYLSVSEFHFTPKIEFETGDPSYLLDSIAYLIKEGCLKRAKMYMPAVDNLAQVDEKIFNVGYDFDPANIEKQSFPAIGLHFTEEGELTERKDGIELDIPFVTNEEVIRLILEWFPKITLIGLFLKTVDELTSLKNILLLLAERNVKAIVYTSLDISEYQSDRVSIVKPRYIDIYSIV